MSGAADNLAASEGCSPTSGEQAAVLLSSAARRKARLMIRKKLSAKQQQAKMVKTKMCRWYTSGKCQSGENCLFAHSVGELRKRPVEEPKKALKKKDGSVQGQPACTQISEFYQPAYISHSHPQYHHQLQRGAFPAYCAPFAQARHTPACVVPYPPPPLGTIFNETESVFNPPGPLSVDTSSNSLISPPRSKEREMVALLEQYAGIDGGAQIVKEEESEEEEEDLRAPFLVPGYYSRGLKFCDSSENHASESTCRSSFCGWNLGGRSEIDVFADAIDRSHYHEKTNHTSTTQNDYFKEKQSDWADDETIKMLEALVRDCAY